jgi:hypothetical protein
MNWLALVVVFFSAISVHAINCTAEYILRKEMCSFAEI